MTQQRRARLVRRHLLDGSGESATEVTRSVLALHATDPATVFLSVLARARLLGIDDVARTMYDDRSLVRVMAMRRTLFVVPTELVPVVHHAVSLDVAATMRRRLVKELRQGPTDPPLPDDVEGWLEQTEREVEAFVAQHGPVDGSRIGESVPALRTALLPRTTKSYDVRRAVTTNLLTLMATEARLVRGRPLGSWTSRRHTWDVGTRWWPDGIVPTDRERARALLVERYLRAFGPATEADVAWWTGWPLGATRAALGSLGTVELDGGLVLADDSEPLEPAAPVGALLPALDPTPMGWKQREWFLPKDSSGLYDAYGNVGPTVWWDGEVVGAWAVRPDGGVATRLVADRGREAAEAIEREAQRLERSIDGKVVVPAFRTPWERQLSSP